MQACLKALPEVRAEAGASSGKTPARARARERRKRERRNRERKVRERRETERRERQRGTRERGEREAGVMVGGGGRETFWARIFVYFLASMPLD